MLMLLIPTILCHYGRFEEVFADVTCKTATDFFKCRNNRILGALSKRVLPTEAFRDALLYFSPYQRKNLEWLHTSILCYWSRHQNRKELRLARRLISIFDDKTGADYASLKMFFTPFTKSLYKRVIVLFYCSLKMYINRYIRPLSDLEKVFRCLYYMCSHLEQNQHFLQKTTLRFIKEKVPIGVSRYSGKGLRIRKTDTRILNLIYQIHKTDVCLNTKMQKVHMLESSKINVRFLRDRLEEIIDIFNSMKKSNNDFAVSLILRVLKNVCGYHTVIKGLGIKFCSSMSLEVKADLKSEFLSNVFKFLRKVEIVCEKLGRIVGIPLEAEMMIQAARQFKVDVDTCIERISKILLMIEQQEVQEKGIKVCGKGLERGLDGSQQISINDHNEKMHFFVERYKFYQHAATLSSNNGESVVRKVKIFILEQCTYEVRSCKRNMCKCSDAMAHLLAE